MMKRASATLAICALAGGATVIGLARPANNTADAAAVNESSAPAPAALAPAVVTIEGFAFGGATVAQPGQTVTVQNLDSAPHTMTARNGSFDSGTVDGGADGSLNLPAEPGTYEFFCSIHPSMVASITVQN